MMDMILTIAAWLSGITLILVFFHFWKKMKARRRQFEKRGLTRTQAIKASWDELRE